MKRLTGIIMFAGLLLVPIVTTGAEIKTFKHIQSIYGDEKGTPLSSPEGVACNEKGDLIVADTGNGRLIRYEFINGKVEGGTEIKLPQMPYPVRVQLNSKGEILALDEKLRRIVRINSDGTFAGYLDGKGVPAPEKFIPRSFKLDGKDNAYLVDIAGERVLVLDPSGNYLKQIRLPGNSGFISDLTVTANGDVFLVDSINPAVYLAAKGGGEFNPLTKALREYAVFPTGIASDNRGALYLTDEHGNAIVAIGTDGAFLARRLVYGWKDGQVNYPGQVCLTSGGSVISVADRNNNKVQVFEILK